MRAPRGAGVGVGLLDDAESDAGRLSASVNGLQLADPVVASGGFLYTPEQKTQMNFVPLTQLQSQSWGAQHQHQQHQLQQQQQVQPPGAQQLVQQAANAAQLSANLASATATAAANSKSPVPMNDLLMQVLLCQQEQQQRLDQLQRALLVANSSRPSAPAAAAPNVPALAPAAPSPVAVGPPPRTLVDNGPPPTLTTLLNSSMQPAAGPSAVAFFDQLSTAPPVSSPASSLTDKRTRNEILAQQSQVAAVRKFLLLV